MPVCAQGSHRSGRVYWCREPTSSKRGDRLDSADARRILREQHFCTLATASTDGAPWVTPVFFNFDETYRLVWESDRSARHSEFIAANPRIAVVVVGGLAAGDEAVYLECTAAAVPEDRLAETLAVFLGGPHRPQEPKAREVRHYQGGASLALYEAVPEHVYVLDITHDEAGLRHDRRREIDLRSGP